jgi:uncharacterized protein YcfJ
MKNTMIVTAALMIAATSAQAENVKAWIEDRYEVRHIDVPYTTQDCVKVNVPIYGTTYKSGNAAEGALLGMILGGLAGKGVTGDDGGAAAGAVIGGLIGADKGGKPRHGREITGYTTERRCTDVTRYKKQKQTVYDYSIISWTQNGVTHSHTFTK